MGEPDAIPACSTPLRPFLDDHAAEIASWAASPEEVRRLAPGTTPPLTPEKILAWRRPGGRPLICPANFARMALANGPAAHANLSDWLRIRGGDPVAYAELNPMPGETTHHWLGHCVIHPALRGIGFGYRFVSELLAFAVRDLSSQRVSLIVFPDNAPAMRCYNQAGFVEVGPEHHEFNGVTETLLRMEFIPGRISARNPQPA